MNDLLVFTCDYPAPPADISLLRRSCELYNVPLVTYGAGGWPGYTRAKIVDAAHFLISREEPFAMYVDGRDTFLLNSAPEILEKYQRIGSPVVIAGEKTCWPDAALGTHYPYPKPPFHNSPWRFINSGGWIGGRYAIIEALRIARSYENTWQSDDQRCWTEAYLRGGIRSFTTIDAGCQIFQCMGGIGAHELGPTGENLITHQKPSVLHFNGRTPHIGMWYRNLTGDLGYKGD